MTRYRHAADSGERAAHQYETMLPKELSREQERILEHAAECAEKELDRALPGVGEDVASLLTDEELWTVIAAWACDQKSGHSCALDAMKRARELREIVRERYVDREVELKQEEF